MKALRLLIVLICFTACTGTPAKSPPPNNEDSTQQRHNTKAAGHDSLSAHTHAGGSLR
ncbi:hypothetical protein [Flaviaesturariibacter amylovorans]|uniref:Uncharacterized protein n=1 Tax=Flaviaesturariibacter amylovorans TaxID=1084520 RepID=A0ABP8GFL4_9BACT